MIYSTPLLDENRKKLYLKIIGYNYNRILLPAYKKVLTMEKQTNYIKDKKNYKLR